MRIKILKWVRGWAKIVDGLITILTLGFYDPDITTKVNEIILIELFRGY